MDTWDESAQSAITAIFSLVIKRSDPSSKLLRKYLDDFITSLYDRPGGRERACAHFSELGAEAIEVARLRGIPLTWEHCLDVLIRKQRDYGPENIRRFGRKGLIVRLHDKIARLENLDSSGQTPENESIQDTLLDIANYCAIGIMWERDEFLLPLKSAGAGEVAQP